MLSESHLKGRVPIDPTPQELIELAETVAVGDAMFLAIEMLQEIGAEDELLLKDRVEDSISSVACIIANLN